MSPGQTGHITGQMGRVPGTDGTHTNGCPAKILYVYWFCFSFPSDVIMFGTFGANFGRKRSGCRRKPPFVAPPFAAAQD